jgi:hypothetical protein
MHWPKYCQWVAAGIGWLCVFCILMLATTTRNTDWMLGYFFTACFCLAMYWGLDKYEHSVVFTDRDAIKKGDRQYRLDLAYDTDPYYYMTDIRGKMCQRCKKLNQTRMITRPDGYKQLKSDKDDEYIHFECLQDYVKYLSSSYKA